MDAWLTPQARAAWTSGRIAICRFREAGRTRGDFLLNAAYADRARINAMLTHARGLPCLVLARELYDRLELRSSAPAPARRHPGAPAVATTIDAARGLTTGLSAADRARTIAAAIAPDAGPSHLRQPGHVPVLRGEADGTRGRATPIQAVLELARATGTAAAGLVCEILDDRGDLAGASELDELAEVLDLPLIDLGLERTALET